MNKNLKKVISAVAALALSASSFIALAADYPDVDSSASYKQAVDELSALGVINGYEDGTFQPDKLVTRAEFTKMLITALGSSELAQAEAATGIDTQFTDVKGDHWASGFVTAGVASSLINGMGDGTFAPDSNVTYAQAMKMLVCAAGYEQWAMDRGGWSEGYMYWGNQLKIGNGVKDVTNDTEITRAQVAQMISNLLVAPVCVDTHEYTYDQFGNKYPKLVAKDGYGVDYQSILTKNHDIYKVKGTIVGTYKSTAGAVKADEVNFEIQNARNWLDQQDQISRTNANAVSIKPLIGESGADEYVRQYVEALIKEVDDDEYEIISVTLAGQNEEVVLEAADFDYENSNYSTGDYVSAGRMYFYNNGKTSSYKINDETTLYINGVEYEGTVDEGIENYVVNNVASDITLIDTPTTDNNSTDGYYDLIMVDYYATAVVDSVEDVDTDEPVINMLDDDVELGYWSLDFDDEDLAYTFTKDGSEISVADLAMYDVLSIKYNVNADFEDSNFYDVVVSSTTDTGKYTLANRTDAEYTVNGTVYKYNSTILGSDPLEQGTTYVLYIDAFGNIAYVEEESVSKKMAIIDSVYAVRGGEAWEAKLIFTDGTTDTYTLKETTGDANVAAAKAAVYENGTDGTKKPAKDRVIDYTINTSNELTIKGSYAPVYEIVDGEYRSSSSKIDSARFSDTTAFLNIADEKDIKAMDPSTLVDGGEYSVFAYDKSKTDSVCRLILVVNGTGEITATTSLAIYNKTLSTENESGDEVDAYDLFVDGENKLVNWESGISATALNQGDAFLYETNASGEIVSVVKVADIDFANTDTVWDAALTDSAALIASGKTYVKGLTTSKYDADLHFGVIMNKTTSSVELSAAVNGVSNENTVTDIAYDENAKFYVIDFNNKAEERISVAGSSSVIAASYSNSDVAANGDVDWNANPERPKQPRLALVKTVDKEATDVYVIIPKKN